MSRPVFTLKLFLIRHYEILIDIIHNFKNSLLKVMQRINKISILCFMTIRSMVYVKLSCTYIIMFVSHRIIYILFNPT